MRVCLCVRVWWFLVFVWIGGLSPHGLNYPFLDGLIDGVFRRDFQEISLNSKFTAVTRQNNGDDNQ